MFKTKRKSQKIKQKPSKKKTAIGKKEVAAQKRKTAQKRNELVQTIVICGIISMVVTIALFFATRKAKIAIAAGGAVAILLLSYKYPRQALWAFLIYLPFSGTVTYAIGGGNAAFQIAKDAFYIPALIALIQSCKKKQFRVFIPKQMISSFSILLMMGQRCGKTHEALGGEIKQHAQRFDANNG